MKQKPKINELSPKPRPHYGSDGITSRTGGKRKTNCICPDYKCNYSSRNWIVDCKPFKNINQTESISSKHCPVHRLELIDIGYASEIPKVGSNERKELIEKYR